MIHLQSPRNLEKVRAFLLSVPQEARKVALRAITEYLIGDESHGLKHEPTYKYVSRKQAYGKVSDAPAGYFSWAQFRKVRAMIASGEIKPGTNQRTGETSAGWKYGTTAGGYVTNITNETTGAYYTQHDRRQARQTALVGWRKVSANISSNIKGALRSGNAAVNKWLKSKGK